MATEGETIAKNVGETTAVVGLTEMTGEGASNVMIEVVDLTEMTEEDASNAMIEVVAQTETSGPTAGTGFVRNAITTISLSDRSAIDVANHETAPKASLLAGTIEGHSKTVTDVVAIEEVGIIVVVEKSSTTTIGNAQNATTSISLSDRNVIDVANHEMALKASHHVVTTEEVAAAMAAATGEVETEVIAMDVALQENRVHERVATLVEIEVPAMHAVLQENHENSAKPGGKVRAMLTTAHHVI